MEEIQEENEYSDDKKKITLELVYDDSDSMTDYYAPDRTYETWLVCSYKGKRITEPRLREGIKSLPAWLQKLNWTWQKGEPYSMSHHPKGQLRFDGGLDIRVKAYGGNSGMSLILGVGYLNGLFKANHKDWDTKEIPGNLEALQNFVADKEKERNRPPTVEQQERALQGHIRDIQNSHAVIDGRGLVVLTPEEKEKQIQELKEKFAQRYIN